MCLYSPNCSIFDTVMDLGNRTAAAASVYGDISAVIQAALGNASQSVQIAEESLALVGLAAYTLTITGPLHYDTL